MSTTKAPDLARLDALRGRFEEAALKQPGVNAVVVFQPDIRRDDTQRQVQEALERRAESKYAGAGGRLWEAATFAHRSAEWVPPFAQSIEELGCQRYWTGSIFESGDTNRGTGSGRTTWECRVYGPPVGHINDARNVFNLLAADASKLVLGQTGDDRDLITKWLVHLAAQKESEVERPRRFLDMSAYPHPSWPHVNPQDPPPWWAVRLDNVFHHSRDAILGAIESSGRTPVPVTATNGPAFATALIAEAIKNDGRLTDGTRLTAMELQRRLNGAGVPVSRSGLYENSEYAEVRKLGNKLGLFTKQPPRRNRQDAIRRGSKNKLTGQVEAADDREPPPDQIAR